MSENKKNSDLRAQIAEVLIEMEHFNRTHPHRTLTQLQLYAKGLEGYIDTVRRILDKNGVGNNPVAAIKIRPVVTKNDVNTPAGLAVFLSRDIKDILPVAKEHTGAAKFLITSLGRTLDDAGFTCIGHVLVLTENQIRRKRDGKRDFGSKKLALLDRCLRANHVRREMELPPELKKHYLEVP